MSKCDDTIKTVKPSCSTTDQHLSPVVEKDFAFTIKSSRKTIMPSVDRTNVLVFPDVKDIPQGAILFNHNVGYVEALSFSKDDKVLIFKNSSDFLGKQVLQPGEYIQEGTEWIVGFRPYVSSSTSSDCFLAVDFTVPNLGATAYASFTNTDCFVLGDSIRLDGVVLKIHEVVSSTQVVLLNEISAVDAGKEITAKSKDCSEFLHKGIVIGEGNPCDNPVSNLTSIIGAVNNDTCEKGILAPTSANQYIASDGSNRWLAKEFPLQDVESTFDGCLVLNPATDPQEYALTLSSSEGFNLYDIVEFSCDTAEPKRQFSIKEIDGNGIVLKPYQFEVNAIESIADDCSGCTLKQVFSCECSLFFAPEYLSGSYSKCHQHNGDPNQTPIDVEFAIDQRVGFYTHEVNTDNSGASPNIQYTNTNPYPVLIDVTARINGFHRNLISGGSEVNQDYVCRYVFNVQDEVDNTVIGATNFSIESSGNQMAGATFDTGEGNWMHANSDIFQTGTGVIKATKVIDPGESIDWKFKELFAYRKNVLPASVQTLEDNMCYEMAWDLTAQYVRGL